MTRFWHWLVEVAPSERAMLEAFFLWIYTPRAHADGTVSKIIEETLAFSHPQSAEAFQRQLEPFMTHETLDRLSGIVAPTLVLAGEDERRCDATPRADCCRGDPGSPVRGAARSPGSSGRRNSCVR